MQVLKSKFVQNTTHKIKFHAFSFSFRSKVKVFSILAASDVVVLIESLLF